ncbi:branched-chain amino acid ABC transporter permease [Pseudonocardia nematodicida]|uniref:Branched-chain amino acid ABC transporter permease n=1 Tax=Pseudonocardia nematodicida TaxID=1206997 RepID=A0ABV1K5N7_9PSEU
MSPVIAPTRPAAATGPGGSTGSRLVGRVPPSVRTLLVWLVVGVAGYAALGGSTLFLATTAVIYALFALGTSIQLGWTGMVSFGQAAYFGAGAYTVALLAPAGLPPLLALVAGAGVAALLGLLFSVAATRVTGVEFTMLTLVFGQILFLLLYRVPAFGGENGLPGIPRGTIFGQSLFSDGAFWVYTVAIVAIVSVGIRRARHSSWGVGLTAVRDDPRRAAALGLDVRMMRITATGVAALLGGLAGALFVQLQGIASPEVMSWVVSGEVVIMCLIGGVATFWGPAVGAVLFTVVSWSLMDTSATPELYFGLGLLIVVLLLPEGLAGAATKARDVLAGRRRGTS